MQRPSIHCMSTLLCYVNNVAKLFIKFQSNISFPHHPPPQASKVVLFTLLWISKDHWRSFQLRRHIHSVWFYKERLFKKVYIMHSFHSPFILYRTILFVATAGSRQESHSRPPFSYKFMRNEQMFSLTSLWTHWLSGLKSSRIWNETSKRVCPHCIVLSKRIFPGILSSRSVLLYSMYQKSFAHTMKNYCRCHVHGISLPYPFLIFNTGWAKIKCIFLSYELAIQG